MQETNPFNPRLVDLECRSWHLLRTLQSHDGDFLGPDPQRGPCHVDGLRHLVLTRRKVHTGGRSLAVCRRPQCRTGGVQGDVAAPDHDHPLADVGLEPLVHVDQKLDGPQHPVGIVARDVEPAPEGGAQSQHHPVVPGAQLVERDIDSESSVEPHFNAEGDDGVDLGLDERAVEAILGDAEHHHPAEQQGRLIDRHLVAVETQIVSGGKASGPPSDDPERLLPLRPITGDHPAIASRFRSVLLGDEPFQRADGDRTVDLAAAAGHLARRGAHAPTHRCKWVGEPCSEIGREVVALGDGGYVGAGIGVDRTCRHARDVAVVVGEVWWEGHQTSPRRCAMRSK